MPGIPGTPKVKIVERKVANEGSSVLPPIVTMAVSAWTTFHDKSKPSFLAWMLIIMVGWLIGAAIIKVCAAVLTDKDLVKSKSNELLGCTWVLHKSLIHTIQSEYQGSQTPQIRITIHRVVTPKNDKTEPYFQQVIDYVGGDGGKAGRRFTTRAGISGYAYRAKAAFAADREDTLPQNHIPNMMKVWGFSADEVKSLHDDRMAWMAVPILQSGDVIGVVYLDSDKVGVFKDNVEKIILQACEGIDQFIQLYYK